MRGLFVIAVLLVGGLALRGLRAGAADVTVRRAAGVVLPIPAGTDLILVSPIRSLDVGALRTRLVSAGFDALPARIDDTAVTVRVPGGTDGGALAARIEATGLARGVELLTTDEFSAKVGEFGACDRALLALTLEVPVLTLKGDEAAEE